jgi:hypothetical protein
MLGMDPGDFKKITELLNSGQLDKFRKSVNFGGFLDKFGVTLDTLQKFLENMLESSEDGTKSFFSVWDLNPGMSLSFPPSSASLVSLPSPYHSPLSLSLILSSFLHSNSRSPPNTSGVSTSDLFPGCP